jgi:hypothetical protein
VNGLDRSRFALPPRLRVDGRRSGCWHRKQSKGVNSKLAWVSPEDFKDEGGDVSIKSWELQLPPNALL